MTPRLLLALPGLAVGIVIWAVCYAGGARSLDAVQVLGGPGRGGRGLSVLLRALRSDGSASAPLGALGLRVVARGAAVEQTWTGTTDATGHAEVWLDFPARSDPPWIRGESANGE